MDSDLRYDLVRSYRDLYKVLMTIFRQACEAVGLSLLEASILKTVEDHPGLSLGELADALFMAESKCSVAVEQLHRQGLVERTRSAEDRRRVVLSLTPAGRAAVNRLFGEGAPLRRILEASLDLSGEEMRRLIAANRTLTENLRKHRGTPYEV
ncbi:MAG: MarR family transcriptional regulator [Firmicutes bacterium]|nr:MarR family transcriptional regulator [Alicyclobacillaceae bacterium]MCL6497058.1 MarR family transcriptional regulator [Bacillota bacterium]